MSRLSFRRAGDPPGSRVPSSALRALDEIESKVGVSERGARAERLDLEELCRTYQDIRPGLETALKLIGRIPVYGSKVAEAIRFLMSLADVACPVG